VRGDSPRRSAAPVSHRGLESRHSCRIGGVADRAMTPPNGYAPAEAFEREHGCTAVEWLAWLPAAVGSRPLQREADNVARIGIGEGALELRWQVLPPRVIALLSMPRLLVSYRFERVRASERAAFMRHFDLYMQRGGG
jgi:hypothetical protein